MARKRMLDPEIFDSAESKGWKADDFLVMVAAICSADDEGMGRVTQIRKNVIGLISEKKFQKSLRNLSDSLSIYQRIYFFLPNFGKYQTISHPKPSKFPKPNPQEIKDLTQNSSRIIPEPFQNDSILISLKEVNLKEVNVNNSDVDNSNDQLSNLQTPNAEISLPLLTDIAEYSPSNFDDLEEVSRSVTNLLNSFCCIEEPDKSTISSFVNVIMKTKQVKKQTAFKYVFDTFLEFHKYSDEKRNLKYLYSRVKGRIDDALIKGREERAKVAKETERKEIQDMGNENIS